MKVSTARKIASKNGVIWANAFDLEFIIRNTKPEGHERIINACKRLLAFVYTGK